MKNEIPIWLTEVQGLWQTHLNFGNTLTTDQFIKEAALSKMNFQLTGVNLSVARGLLFSYHAETIP